MSDNVDDLILDLLEWLASGPRSYAEVLDTWRTSCPRLPVWEEANDRGYVERRRESDGPVLVMVSATGFEHLFRSRPRAQTQQRVVVS
jgi:trans-aconitate 2-methyltransferase